MKKRKNLINKITKIGILSAIASILYYLKFNLPFLFPSFLEIQFSNLPALIGGLALGPIEGIIIVVIKTLIKLPSTSTGCVGELADLLIGVMTIGSASLIYYKFRTKKGGALALSAGAIVWVIASVLCNWLFLIDFYSEFYAGIGGLDMIIAECQKVIPSINKDNFMGMYLLYAIVPFNLVLASVVSFITLIVYKKISKIFKEDFFRHKEKKDESSDCQ